MPLGDAFEGIAHARSESSNARAGRKTATVSGWSAFPALQMMIEPRSQSTRETVLQGRWNSP